MFVSNACTAKEFRADVLGEIKRRTKQLSDQQTRTKRVYRLREIQSAKDELNSLLLFLECILIPFDGDTALRTKGEWPAPDVVFSNPAEHRTEGGL